MSAVKYCRAVMAVCALAAACLSLGAETAIGSSSRPLAESASRCTPQVVHTAIGPTRMRFVLHGRVTCATAHRVVRNYFAEGVAKCQGSGCWITLPSGWQCETSSGETTRQTGHITTCARDGATIDTYKQ